MHGQEYVLKGEDPKVNKAFSGPTDMSLRNISPKKKTAISQLITTKKSMSKRVEACDRLTLRPKTVKSEELRKKKGV